MACPQKFALKFLLVFFLNSVRNTNPFPRHMQDILANVLLFYLIPSMSMFLALDDSFAVLYKSENPMIYWYGFLGQSNLGKLVLLNKYYLEIRPSSFDHQVSKILELCMPKL